jgi:hypothetical protein
MRNIFANGMDRMMSTAVMPAKQPLAAKPQRRTSRASVRLVTTCLLLQMSTLLLLSCAREGILRPVEEPTARLEPWSIESYSEFVRRNMAYLDDIYTTEYVAHEFVVDTDAGAVRIQELLDIDAAQRLLQGIDLPHSALGQKIRGILRYVLDTFDYRVDPDRWVSVADVIRKGRADCKGLSLLLVSLLTAAGIEAYAGISNGHMWVCAHDGHCWQVLETDTDPVRAGIYGLPGFYEHPLFKIYPHVSCKRKARQSRSAHRRSRPVAAAKKSQFQPLKFKPVAAVSVPTDPSGRGGFPQRFFDGKPEFFESVGFFQVGTGTQSLGLLHAPVF